MYTLCALGAWVVWRVLYRFRVVGHKMPKVEKGAAGRVIICNHISMTDIIFLATSTFRWPKPVIMGKEELFSIHPVLSWLFRSWGAVPVSRGKGDTDALQEVVAQVKAGRDLLVFPEGTRSKNGELGMLKSGAFFIAALAGAEVLPCRILYAGGRPKLFTKVRLAVGRPLSLQELGLDGDWNGVPQPSALRKARACAAQALEELRAEYIHTVEN